MDSTNIQLAQMEIIRRVLDISDIEFLDRIKYFIENNDDEIIKARREYKRGESLRFDNATEAQKWMDSL